jgi:hypothetical protein
MNRIARFVVFAAIATTALAASPALAHDRDCDHPAAPTAAYPAYSAYPVAPAPIAYTQAPVYAAPVYAPAPAYAPARWNDGWRFRELREEYRHLDEARDQFYATWHGNPWRRNRFDGWYASRRAELDHRWAELEQHRHAW